MHRENIQKYITHNGEKYIFHKYMAERYSLDKGYFYIYHITRTKDKANYDPYTYEAVIKHNGRLYVRDNWDFYTQKDTPTRTKLKELYYELIDKFENMAYLVKAIIDMPFDFRIKQQSETQLEKDFRTNYTYMRNFAFSSYEKNLKLIEKLEYIRDNLQKYKDYLNKEYRKMY